MKYSHFIPFLYLEMIWPFIHNCLICDKIRRIVKSLSGLLQKIQTPATFDNKYIEPNSIIQLSCDSMGGIEHSPNKTNVCETNCKIQIILPGYMEHDPKQNLP